MNRAWRRACSVWLGLAVGGCLAIEPDPPEGSAGASSGPGDASTSMPTTGPMGSSGATDGPSRDTGDTAVDSGDGTTTTAGGPDGVGCEMGICLPPEVCCAAMAGSVCAETCGPDALPQACDGPEDCGGTTCCFGLAGGSQCADACEGLTPDVACHADADCMGGTCTPHPFIPWISVCE